MTEDSMAMKRKTSFYIEQILSPSFGTPNSAKSKIQIETSQEQSSTEKHKQVNGSTKMLLEDRLKSPVPSDSSFVPAWIFCTRYSDRPASGTVWVTCKN
jgi:hypothetical protein